MRISTIPDDEGYNLLAAKSDYCQVYLDGVNVTKKYLIHTVDEDENWIGIYVDKDKIIQLDEYNEPITDVMYGEVKIKFRSGKDV